MRLAEIQAIAAEWVTNGGSFCEAWATLDEFCFNKPDIALRIIEEIHHLIASATPIDYALMANLAAGPLETLVMRNGDSVIEGIERLARTDPEFRKCLTGVWKNDASDELFARIQKAADPNFRL